MENELNLSSRDLLLWQQDVEMKTVTYKKSKNKKKTLWSPEIKKLEADVFLQSN